MNEEDSRELLAYIREAMRERGFADMDSRIHSELSVSIEGEQELLLAYLSALETELRLESSSSANRVLETLSETLETGTAPRSFLLEFSGGDQQIFGMQTFDFGDLPDLGPLAQDLNDLRREIRGSEGYQDT